MSRNRLTRKPTKFGRVIRNIGITIVGIATAILGAKVGDIPVELPEAIQTIATHALTAGTVAIGIGQAVNPDDK